MDEELMTVIARLYHFMMHAYISSRGAYHVPNGHMTQFHALCDYIEQG
jgi:hypothetical protein